MTLNQSSIGIIFAAEVHKCKRNQDGNPSTEHHRHQDYHVDIGISFISVKLITCHFLVHLFLENFTLVFFKRLCAADPLIDEQHDPSDEKINHQEVGVNW